MTYLNVDEIDSALVNLAAAYPTASELISAPHPTHEDRLCRILKIGTAGDGPRPGVLLLGGVHAREWVPPDALVALCADLLEASDTGTGLRYGNGYFAANDIRRVLDCLDVIVFPCVNPDGRHFSQTREPGWRKNRRPHRSGGACIGVDLNRNFDFLWEHSTKFAADSNVRTSANPCDTEVYRGPAPASEPETRNVVWLLDRNPQLRWFVDVHSAVPVVLHSWGTDHNQSTSADQTFSNPLFDAVRGRPDDTAYGEFISADDLATVTTAARCVSDAIAAVRGEVYGAEQAYSLYPTSGASDDYAFSRAFTDPIRAPLYGFTIECGRSFQPPWSEAENVIRDVSAGLLALLLHAVDRAVVGPVVLGISDAH